VIGEQDENLGRDNRSQHERCAELPTPRRHWKRDDATGEERPHQRVNDFHRAQCGTSTHPDAA
jgi:hypothetical protein